MNFDFLVRLSKHNLYNWLVYKYSHISLNTLFVKIGSEFSLVSLTITSRLKGRLTSAKISLNKPYMIWYLVFTFMWAVDLHGIKTTVDSLRH